MYLLLNKLTVKDFIKLSACYTVPEGVVSKFSFDWVVLLTPTDVLSAAFLSLTNGSRKAWDLAVSKITLWHDKVNPWEDPCGRGYVLEIGMTLHLPTIIYIVCSQSHTLTHSPPAMATMNQIHSRGDRLIETKEALGKIVRCKEEIVELMW
jgi:hypothetical protein